MGMGTGMSGASTYPRPQTQRSPFAVVEEIGARQLYPWQHRQQGSGSLSAAGEGFSLGVHVLLSYDSAFCLFISAFLLSIIIRVFLYNWCPQIRIPEALEFQKCDFISGLYVQLFLIQCDIVPCLKGDSLCCKEDP
jgi:hypothetical protein